VAILSSAIQNKPDVTVKDTPELRQAFGVGEATASSKAESRNAVTNLINRIKSEMGLEFTPQGMALIIRWVEQA